MQLEDCYGTHSLSFARFRSSWAAVKVATLLVPAREALRLDAGPMLCLDLLSIVANGTWIGCGFVMADMPLK